GGQFLVSSGGQFVVSPDSTRLEFEHRTSLNRGPVRRSALVPEPKAVFAGTRQEPELNTFCEIARDLA
ncbi:MAG: hypothetical protein ACOYOJ_22300, partial [Alsobacter sp.]